LSEARERFYQQHEAGGEHPQQHYKDRLRDAAVYIRQIDDLNAELVKALQQCYDHLGWNPAKVPAHVADDALAALKKARGE
jgi:hypothetical protein